MWVFEHLAIRNIDDLPSDTYGFIYKLNFTDGTCYYGKKNLYKKVTLPVLKNGTQRPNSERIGKNKGGKRVYFDIVTKESDWLDYEGSSEHTEGLVLSNKEILALATSKRELTYLEAQCLFCTDAITEEDCRNANILNLFFRDNLK